MGTGWRKALCTTVQRDTESSSPEEPRPGHSPKRDGKFSFFRRSRSSPSTPRVQHHTQSQPSTPVLRIRTGSPAGLPNDDIFERSSAQTQAFAKATADEAATPRTGLRSLKLPFVASNPPSPRSPSRLALLLKNHLRFTRSKCGICLQSVKAAKGEAIFTAECSHTFHLHCIAAASSSQPEFCSVCAAPWRRAPLLCSVYSEDKPQQQRPSFPEGEQLSVRLPRKASTVTVRVYNDDETLPSNASACCHPIPEAEDEHAEGEQSGKELRGGVRVVASPDAAPLSTGRVHENHVIAVRVKAPAPAANPPAAPLLDPSLRAPIDLVTVLDAGVNLQMLRRAMRLLLSCLGPRDRLSIVVTADGAKRLLPLRRMSADGQRSVRRIVERHVFDEERGPSAAKEEGLGKAVKVLEDRRESNPVAAVLLLGEDDEDRGRLQRSSILSKRFVLIRVPLNGAEHCSFARLVGGRLSVVCRDVRLEFSFPSGEVRSVYSGCRHVALGGAGRFRIGDLHAGEEKELLLEMKLNSSTVVAQGADALLPLMVRCSYRDPTAQKLVQGGEHSLPVFFSRGRDSAAAPRVELLRSAFVTARAVAEARRLADAGDFATGLQLLVSTRRLLLQRSSVCPRENLRGVDLELEELRWRRRQAASAALDSNSATGEALTPMSAWRAAEKLAKVAIMRKSLNRVRDLHGFENARF